MSGFFAIVVVLALRVNTEHQSSGKTCDTHSDCKDPKRGKCYYRSGNSGPKECTTCCNSKHCAQFSFPSPFVSKCMSGECTQGDCRSNADCSNKKASKCTAANAASKPRCTPCLKTRDCSHFGSNHVCRQGTCATAPSHQCMTDDDCKSPKASICQKRETGNICRAECTSDNECKTWSKPVCGKTKCTKCVSDHDCDKFIGQQGFDHFSCDEGKCKPCTSSGDILEGEQTTTNPVPTSTSRPVTTTEVPAQASSTTAPVTQTSSATESAPQGGTKTLWDVEVVCGPFKCTGAADCAQKEEEFDIACDKKIAEKAAEAKNKAATDDSTENWSVDCGTWKCRHGQDCDAVKRAFDRECNEKILAAEAAAAGGGENVKSVGSNSTPGSTGGASAKSVGSANSVGSSNSVGSNSTPDSTGGSLTAGQSCEGAFWNQCANGYLCKKDGASCSSEEAAILGCRCTPWTCSGTETSSTCPAELECKKSDSPHADKCTDGPNESKLCLCYRKLSGSLRATDSDSGSGAIIFAIIGILAVVLLAACAVGGFYVFKKKQKEAHFKSTASDDLSSTNVEKANVAFTNSGKDGSFVRRSSGMSHTSAATFRSEMTKSSNPHARTRKRNLRAGAGGRSKINAPLANSPKGKMKHVQGGANFSGGAE